MSFSMENNAELYEQFLNEPDAFYQKASDDLLKEALKLTYTERFLMLTKLYKIQKTLQKAKIIHQPSIPNK